MTIKGNIYKCKAEGEYYGFENGQKTTKHYELEFLLDDNAKKQGFLSVFKRSLNAKGDNAVKRMMLKKYPDYKKYRTHAIMEVTNLSQKGAPVNELQLMNRSQIIAFINKRGLPIEPDLYPEVTDLRQALRDYRENREVFLKRQADRSKFKGPRLQVQRSVDILNDPDFDISKLDKRAASNLKKQKAPVVVSPTEAYNDDEKVQYDLIDVPDDEYPEDEISIPEYDEEDELNKVLDGV